MGDEFYTLEQVAELLELHVRTVRSYVREGRIKAVRIGKQYRVTRADLEAFTSNKLPRATTQVVQTSRRVEVTTVVQIDAIDPDNASRIANTLVATSNGAARNDDSGAGRDSSAQVNCRYNETYASLKVMLTANLETTTGLLKLIALLLEQPR